MTLTEPVIAMIDKADLPTDIRSSLMEFFRTNRPTAELARQIDANQNLQHLLDQILEVEERKLRHVGEAMAEYEAKRKAEQNRSVSRATAKVVRFTPVSPVPSVSTATADDGVARAGG